MKKSEILKKIKEDLGLFASRNDDMEYSSDYLVKTKVNLLDDSGRTITVPTGEEEFVIKIKLKRK
jgi:hypothetical protein